MAKYIRVVSDAGGVEFINLEKIVRASCSVKTMRRGGEVEPLSMLDPNMPKITPVEVTTIVWIRLFTANGDGLVRFDSESKADIWAEQNLGIVDITMQSQYSPAPKIARPMR